MADQPVPAAVPDDRDNFAWFEKLYADARGDETKIPWAAFKPRPSFAEWLAREQPDGTAKRACVVGCGLGDDAKALADRGYDVTAFDIAPTAVEWSRRRFADAAIHFVVADVTDPPGAWNPAFDFVLEIYTLQAMPRPPRARAFAAIAALVKPGGELLVICSGREERESDRDSPPWPLTRAELARFTDGGLTEKRFEVLPYEWQGLPRQQFRVLYRR